MKLTATNPIDLIPQICTYRRAHDSAGELQFRTDFKQLLLDVSGAEVNEDDFGNLWLDIGATDVLWVAHMDSVHRTLPDKVSQKVTVDNNLLSLAEPDDCLGADDAVGLGVLVNLISRGVEGRYLFTRGEEVGLLGADYIVSSTPDLLKQSKISIEIDRRGTKEIITYQSTGECASDEFALALAQQLNMGHKPSDKGVYTDNALFAEFIPEVVNIAAGYEGAHTSNESTDLAYAQELANALAKVDWNALPIKRKPAPPYYGAGAKYNRVDYTAPLSFDELYDLCLTRPEVAAAILCSLGVNEFDIEDAQLDLDDYVSYIDYDINDEDYGKEDTYYGNEYPQPLRSPSFRD